jgi:redox-sensitive bicupin YhaK (pirin superfamily)
MHRDSLGSEQIIRPGAVNWMTAGRMIVHSERTPPEARAAGHRVHGIQSWVGLPTADEETTPSFVHVGANDLPTTRVGGAHLKIVSGKAYGIEAPVPTFSPIFYIDAVLDAGASLAMTNEYPERGVFVVDGEVEIGGTKYSNGALVVLDADEKISIAAADKARVMLAGGAPLDGPRTVWWNFVASSKELLERAKSEWRTNPQGHIAGDDEFIPLPD